MSDKLKCVCLPKRYIPKVGLDALDWFHTPDAFDLTVIGMLHYSGITTNAQLGFFQDNISKQVFWSEYTMDNGYPIKEEGEQYGLWYVEPDDVEWKLFYFISSWNYNWYGSVSDKERSELIRDVKIALRKAPTLKQMDEIRAFYRSKQPFEPWWV